MKALLDLDLNAARHGRDHIPETARWLTHLRCRLFAKAMGLAHRSCKLGTKLSLSLGILASELRSKHRFTAFVFPSHFAHPGRDDGLQLALPWTALLGLSSTDLEQVHRDQAKVLGIGNRVLNQRISNPEQNSTQLGPSCLCLQCHEAGQFGHPLTNTLFVHRFALSFHNR